MKRLVLAVLVLGWFSCSPGYESGKTKCSTSGRCPDGFECNSRNVCVTAGTSDHDGHGGTTGGGTGGQTTTPCTPSSSDSACTVCGKSACCTQYNACVSNSACLSLAACYSGCTTDSCISSCNAAYPGGVSPAVDYALCLNSYCSAECAGSGGSTGTGGRTGGTGGSTGGSTGTARIKFCHGLSTSSSPSVALTLNVNGTKVTTTTGTCQPTNSCQTVPAGTAVPISVLNGSTSVVSGTITIESGKDLLLRAILDSSNAVIVRASRAQGICSGGTGTAGTLAKFCNFLSKSTGDYVATLNINGSSISAMSGNCSPIGSCTSISSGTDVPISLLEGSTTVLSGTFPSIVSGTNMVFYSDLDTDGSPSIFGSTYSSGICSPASAGSLLANPMVFMTPWSAMAQTFASGVPGELRESVMTLVPNPDSATPPSTEYRSISNRRK